MRNLKEPGKEWTMLQRDEMIRDQRTRAGTFPAILVVYAVLVGAFIATGMAMV